MEFRMANGDLSPEQNRPKAYCLYADKNISKLEHCPLYNFDDEGQICCAVYCDHYTEEV